MPARLNAAIWLTQAAMFSRFSPLPSSVSRELPILMTQVLALLKDSLLLTVNP